MIDPRREQPDFQRERPSVSTVLEVLAHRRRRCVLSCLQGCDEPMALAELADEVATMEAGTPLTEASSEPVERVHRSLYHTHVPKLADAQLVRYDGDRDVVVLTPRADQLEEFQDLLAVD